ncbi:hypothetical protein H310_09901 [Aphanomyces invadans]|uniref:ACB domain-containing protein n=1 Tax=Aphanomyces invadans TaxID=157072 RepID=A0A024TSE4_9STRA|nr:hypothetical protein H310_09901 [Aphanomyces invadans]ETV97080.1 hypothetical protein H310_09901 [Aphanomyces invadans]|eukprot:XP_008874326.1 hypothetical protein H310_09901 [Aphanomyces invadans]
MVALRVPPLVWIGAAAVVAAVVLRNVVSSTARYGKAAGRKGVMLEGAPLTELDKHFAHASAYVSSNPKQSISNEEKLVLYAFFKQATMGDCIDSKPSIVDFVAKAKWDAWQGLAGMTAIEAKKRYLEVVSSIYPNYSYGAQLPSKCTSEVSDSESDGGGDMSLTPLMSQVIVDKTTKEWQVEENAFHFAKTGQLDALQDIVANSSDDVINQKDDEGRTMLHWAVDRNQPNVVAALLAQHANVRATDNDGMTPLHYAVSCEYVELIDLLLQHGADPQQPDADGETPFASATKCMQAHITAALKRLDTSA